MQPRSPSDPVPNALIETLSLVLYWLPRSYTKFMPNSKFFGNIPPLMENRASANEIQVSATAKVHLTWAPVSELAKPFLGSGFLIPASAT